MVTTQTWVHVCSRNPISQIFDSIARMLVYVASLNIQIYKLGPCFLSPDPFDNHHPCNYAQHGSLRSMNLSPTPYIYIFRTPLLPPLLNAEVALGHVHIPCWSLHQGNLERLACSAERDDAEDGSVLESHPPALAFTASLGNLEIFAHFTTVP